MPLDDEQVKRLLSAKSRVTPYVGRYVGNEGMLATVDLGDQRVTVPFASSGIVPEINEPVHVWSVDGSLMMLGPTAPKPGLGVVATVAGDYVNVTTDFGTFLMPYGPPSDPPTSGDAVSINWSTGASCMKLSTSPDPVEPPVNPGGGGEVVQPPVVRTVEFRAVDAGSTDRGAARWWTDRPYASNSTFGAWFYGSQIKDTIPAGAEFVGLEIYISYHQRQGGAPRFALHDQTGKAGVPGFGGYTEWAPGSGWQTPPDPAGWFAALKAGGDRWGVGLNQGGFNIFRSLAQDGMSGALKITWRA
ncbi:hypothetical protein [Microbacterium sp. A1-JK]|uniref:hypothetical protein n=1 Tax=Microbacterium sp. A1-JK TaxID=3177516 RepID=UPI003888909B